MYGHAIQKGQRFYGLISAGYIVKQSPTMAAMITGMVDGTMPDEFEGGV
jgi:hypothetical protein